MLNSLYHNPDKYSIKKKGRGKEMREESNIARRKKNTKPISLVNVLDYRILHCSRKMFQDKGLFWEF